MLRIDAARKPWDKNQNKQSDQHIFSNSPLSSLFFLCARHESKTVNNTKQWKKEHLYCHPPSFSHPFPMGRPTLLFPLHHWMMDEPWPTSPPGQHLASFSQPNHSFFPNHSHLSRPGTIPGPPPLLLQWYALCASGMRKHQMTYSV